MGDKKGIILILFVCLISFSFISAWADNGSAVQNVDGCNTLNTTGASYVLTGNVSSTGTCFSISAQNITLDCNGNWITYSTGGAGSTSGIGTNQFNSTIQNCNVLDGNWGSSNFGRYAIILSPSSSFVKLLNVTAISGTEYGVYISSSYNNTLSNVNVSSNKSYGMSISTSSYNILNNVRMISLYSEEDFLFGFSTISNCNNDFNNVTGYGGKPVLFINESNLSMDNVDGSSIILCNSNFSNITNSNFTRGGIRMYYSNYNNLTSLRGISDKGGPGVYLSSSSYNILDNIYANAIYFGITLEYSDNNYLNYINASSNNLYTIEIWNSNNNILNNSIGNSRDYYGIHLSGASNSSIYNTSAISNSNIPLKFEWSSNSNSIIKSKFISLNKEENLIEIASDSSFNTFYGNNFTETSGYYVQDLNGSNYYNTTINGKGEGNIWDDVMNGSVVITGNVSSTLNPSLYIGEYGADYPYNNTNSFGKISGNVVDYAPLTNNLVPISCTVLSSAGTTYTLTQNVSSTGTCFNITAQNITLDCDDYWITYSTGGAANTFGIYTNQFNTTVKNCNVLDGNWTNSNAERHGIYFNSSNNSLIFNNSVNVSNSRAIFLHSSSNFNNLTSNRLNSVSGYAIRLQSSFNNSLYNINAYSQTNYAIYIHSSSNNTLSNNNFTGNTGILIGYGSSNNNISTSNVTGIDETGGYPIWIYQCNYNHFSDINAYAIDGYGAGVSLDSSNYSTFFNINTTCTTTSGVYDMGIYLYNSHFNNFTNIFSNSTSSAVALEYSSYNNFSNLEANSNYDDLVDYNGIYFWESSYNRIINSNITSKTNYGFSLTDNSKFNILNEVNIISNLNISLKFKESASSNIVANSTFISSNGQENLLDIDSTCNFNTFYGNNFTETSGYYVQDLNGSNYYNTTINGKGEGNIWDDVMNGSVDIKGNISSTLDSSLYIGEYGTRYPYNSTNSFGKISGNVVDYAPLTNQFEGELPIYPNISFVSPTTSSGNHVQTFITTNVSVQNASSVVNLTIFLYNSSSGNLIVQNSTTSNKLLWNITGLSVGNYSLNASILDDNNLTNSTSILAINLSAASDTFSPTYSSVSNNSTYAGQSSKFSVNINDETALETNGQYIFSTNNSGEWVNDTAVNFTSTPSWANVSKTLNSNVGMVVGYMWYFNDSEGNMNSTSVYKLTTTQAPVVDPPSSGGGGGGSAAQVQTQYQLGREFSEQGESLKLRKNYQVGFRHQEESHTLTVNSFTTNTAKITIRSDPITATLEKDVTQGFDLDGEEGNDFEITYQGTSGSEAQFFIKKIVEVSGESEVFVNSEGGEAKETTTNQISTDELFGTSGSGSENVDVAREKTKRAKNPFRTVLISLIVMGAIIAGLYAIGKNEKKKKEHYLGFFDN